MDKTVVKNGQEEKTLITCPHCLDVTTMAVKHDPFVGVREKGEYYRKEENGVTNLRSEGIKECKACHRKFMFRFSTTVVCATAPYPFEGMA